MKRMGARKLGLGFGSAVLLVSLAFLAASCGGKSSSSSKPQGGDNTITVNWGTEPPSLDPGLATDTTSANILQNIMDPLVKLGAGPRSRCRAWRESWDGVGRRQDRHVQAAQRTASGRTATL